MTNKSNDVDDIDILTKIAAIKKELANLSEKTIDISMQEKNAQTSSV